jgi:membrane protein
MLRLAANVILMVAQRSRAERYSQVAGSLAFTTLLSIVPLLTVALAVVSRLPVSSMLRAALERFLLDNLLPQKAGVVIAEYVLRFSEKATHLTLAGALLLVVAAFALMLTIDHAFNGIWRVVRPRPLWSRVLAHALVLALGPMLLGAALAATTYAVSTSLGWVDEPLWLRRFLFGLLPALTLIGLFSLLFATVPNKAVRGLDAFAGGLLTALGLIAMQRLFSLFVVSFPAYNLIYGAFAAVPIFLLWLYLSWLVVLLGATLTAVLPEARRRASGGGRLRLAGRRG